MTGNVKDSTVRQRRNCGRPLFCVIESADNGSYGALEDLSALTRDWMESIGHAADGWPESVHDVLHGTNAARRWVREDDDGQRHTFALVDRKDHDVLFAVSSRRKRNVVGQLTENLATNFLLELLATRGPNADRLYGTIGAVHSGRLLRQGVPGAHLIDACREWDVVLRCKDLHVDPVVDPSPYAALIALAQNAENATHLIKNSSAHRISAHRNGICKWARTVTHPVVAVHPETRAMSWDHDVAAALREVVALLRDGKTWDQAADAVGDRIPSYRLQAEPDCASVQVRQNLRTRSKRNEERRRCGRAEVPLKLLPDGSVNPAYRPETILDQAYPAAALRSLFLGGAGIGGDDLATALEQLDDSLGGLHPEDTSLEMLSTGLFRRLVVDQDSSNLTLKRYQYVEFQLPAPVVDDSQPWVLTRDDVAFLKAMRNGPPGTGNFGTLPLIGFFRVEVDAELYTSSGILAGAGGNNVVLTHLDGTTHSGVVAWSTGLSSENRIYRVWFGRDADQRKTRRSLCIARVTADAAHRSFIEAVERAINNNPEAASFEVRDAATRPEELALRAAQRRLETATERFSGCGEALVSSGLSASMRAHLEQQASDAEAELVAARTAVSDAQGAVRAHIDDTVPLGALIDVLAALQLPLPLDPDIARRVQARLRDLVRDALVVVDPVTQKLQWTATLELRSDTGLILRLPIAGEMPNTAKDPWLGGPAGTFWGRRCTIEEAMRSHGLATVIAKTGLWRSHIARRLVADAARRGVEWRGPNAVNLFVRSPHREVIRAGFAILHDDRSSQVPDAVVEEVRRVFFGPGPDLPHPKACNWVPGSTKGRHVAALLAILGTGKPM